MFQGLVYKTPAPVCSILQLYTRSSDRDRTLMSAQCALAGLYPPQGFQVWDAEINWQPIPVHAVPVEDDNVLYGGEECARFNELKNQAYTSDVADALMEEHKVGEATL
jgi:lysosomal acid phosphatase